jgi:hypothetical protein
MRRFYILIFGDGIRHKPQVKLQIIRYFDDLDSLSCQYVRFEILQNTRPFYLDRNRNLEFLFVVRIEPIKPTISVHTSYGKLIAQLFLTNHGATQTRFCRIDLGLVADKLHYVFIQRMEKMGENLTHLIRAFSFAI